MVNNLLSWPTDRLTNRAAVEDPIEIPAKAERPLGSRGPLGVDHFTWPGGKKPGKGRREEQSKQRRIESPLDPGDRASRNPSVAPEYRIGGFIASWNCGRKKGELHF